jgi:hypothetical protein
MTDKEEKLLKFETEKDPGFKVMYADGVVGDLNPERGSLTFFYDAPEIETDSKGNCSVKSLTRHLAFEIRLSPEKWVIIARWMAQHADYYEKWKNEQLKNKKE